MEVLNYLGIHTTSADACKKSRRISPKSLLAQLKLDVCPELPPSVVPRDCTGRYILHHDVKCVKKYTGTWVVMAAYVTHYQHHHLSDIHHCRNCPQLLPRYLSLLALYTVLTKQAQQYYILAVKSHLPDMPNSPTPLIWRWILFKEWLRRMKIRTRNYHAGPKKTDPQSDLYYDYRTMRPRPTQTAENAHPGVVYYA